jgi:hypothetical protein
LTLRNPPLALVALIVLFRLSFCLFKEPKLGSEHVVLGADTDGLPSDSGINNFDDLRKVLDVFQKKGWMIKLFEPFLMETMPAF